MQALNPIILKLDLRAWVSDSVSGDAELWAKRHITSSPNHLYCGNQGTLHPQPTIPIVETKTHCTPNPPSLLWRSRHTAPQPTISIVGAKVHCIPNPPSLLWEPRHTASPTHCPYCGQRGTLYLLPTVSIVGTKTHCIPTSTSHYSSNFSVFCIWEIC